MILAALIATIVIGYGVYYYWNDHRWDVDPISVMPAPMDPKNWEVGPIQYGKRVSSGVPLNPEPHPEGWMVRVPPLAGSIRYITMRCPPLRPYKGLRLVARVEIDSGALKARSDPEAPTIMCVYFERRNLKWSGDKYEAYRWYAKAKHLSPIFDGTHIFEIDFTDFWSAVETSDNANNPAGFVAALEDTGRWGFVVGGGTGEGHGIYSTGEARIIVKEAKPVAQ